MKFLICLKWNFIKTIVPNIEVIPEEHMIFVHRETTSIKIFK